MSTYRIESIRHESTQTGLTLEEASKFLRLATKTTEEKAIYHEPVRGAWYVFREQESEPVLLPKERITKTGFLETEWAEWSANWYKACDRIAEYAGVGLAWGME